MKTLPSLWIGICLTLGMIAASQLDAEMRIDPTSRLKVKFYEQMSEDAKPKVHLEEAILCDIRSTVEFAKLRPIKSTIDDDRWHVGTKVSGYCSGVLSKPTVVDLKIEHSELVRQEDPATTEVYSAQTYFVRTELNFDEMKKVPLGKGIWCELTMVANSPRY